MRRLILATILAASAGSMPAFAGDQDFKLVNKTGYQINEVYVGPVSSDSWGNDIMGKGALAADDAVNITFSAANTVCHYDMMVKYDDGDTAQWHDLNLCQISSVSLFWDKNKNVTRAVTD